MRRTSLFIVLLFVAALVAGCSSSDSGSSAGSAGTAAPGTSAGDSAGAAASDIAGTDALGKATLHVSAAASLTESFGTIKDDFEKLHPGVKVVTNFGASSELVQQLQAGSPTDVLATADDKTMKVATDAGLVDPPTTFAKNQLAIIVIPSNPKGIKTVTDLGKDGVTFVLCAPEVPCGKYGKQILDQAGVTANPVSLEANVKAAVTRVASGEVDAALVYVTDVKAARNQVEGVTIPEDQNVVATYPIATVKDSKQQKAAQAFIDYITSGPGQQVLADAGFQPAT